MHSNLYALVCKPDRILKGLLLPFGVSVHFCSLQEPEDSSLRLRNWTCGHPTYTGGALFCSVVRSRRARWNGPHRAQVSLRKVVTGWAVAGHTWQSSASGLGTLPPTPCLLFDATCACIPSLQPVSGACFWSPRTGGSFPGGDREADAEGVREKKPRASASRL